MMGARTAPGSKVQGAPLGLPAGALGSLAGSVATPPRTAKAAHFRARHSPQLTATRRRPARGERARPAGRRSRAYKIGILYGPRAERYCRTDAAPRARNKQNGKFCIVGGTASARRARPLWWRRGFSRSYSQFHRRTAKLLSVWFFHFTPKHREKQSFS